MTRQVLVKLEIGISSRDLVKQLDSNPGERGDKIFANCGVETPFFDTVLKRLLAANELCRDPDVVKKIDFDAIESIRSRCFAILRELSELENQ